jgi:NADH dehydrogenase FAD-containing subunit
MKTIILAGSGHAHLEVIKAITKQQSSANNYIVISPQKYTYYSGLIPRLISGDITVGDLTIDSAKFAEDKGIRYIQSSVIAVDADNKFVLLNSGVSIKFDILSLNIGGTPIRIPAESEINCIYLRPFDEFIPAWHRAEKVIAEHPSPTILVVGGGAAAVEVATALKIKMDRQKTERGKVILVSKSPRLCENYKDYISRAIEKKLFQFNIQVYLNEPASQIFANNIVLSTGEKIEFDSVFVVTPTGPSPILLSQKTDSALCLAPNIFAMGDGAIIKGGAPLPRSGVIAVRQGQHFVKSLNKILSGQGPTDFKISSNQLNILISGPHTARLVWGRLTFDGRWPLWLKNWIDSRYIQQFK